MPLGWSLVAVPFLIALNAFFVAAEYAVVAIRPQQIEAMRLKRWKRAARAIERLKSNPASAIGAIQVCITMTNLLLGWIGEPAMSALLIRMLGPLGQVIPPVAFHTGSLILAFVIVTLLTVVFSELLPKALTLRYVATAAALTAVPISVIGRTIQPLVWLMNAMANAVTKPLGLGSVDEIEKENVTVGELRLMATQAGEQGALTDRSKSLVLNSLAIAERRAEQIMVPRTKIAYLDLQLSMDDNRRVMNEYLYTRLPLCDGGIDHVIGVVPTKEFLSAYNAEGDVRVLSLIAHPPVFVPVNMPLDRLLAAFHENRTQMIFLVDEHGGVEGLVTLQDVVDELVGEIREATEIGMPPKVVFKRQGEGRHVLVVPGDTPVHELSRLLNLSDWATGEPVVTVGGLITARLGRFPQAGDEVEVDRVRLRVLEADKAVTKIEVTGPAPPPDASAAPDAA